jgi:hypothetical protein
MSIAGTPAAPASAQLMGQLQTLYCPATVMNEGVHKNSGHECSNNRQNQ